MHNPKYSERLEQSVYNECRGAGGGGVWGRVIAANFSDHAMCSLFILQNEFELCFSV